MTPRRTYHQNIWSSGRDVELFLPPSSSFSMIQLPVVIYDMINGTRFSQWWSRAVVPVVPVDIRGSGRAVGYVKCLWWHVAVRPPFLFIVFL